MVSGDETQGDLTIQGYGGPWAPRGARQQRRLRKSITKEAVTDLQQLFWPMGGLLWTRCWKRCCQSRKRLVLTIPAQVWVSEMHSESH